MLWSESEFKLVSHKCITSTIRCTSQLWCEVSCVVNWTQVSSSSKPIFPTHCYILRIFLWELNIVIFRLFQWPWLFLKFILQINWRLKTTGACWKLVWPQLTILCVSVIIEVHLLEDLDAFNRLIGATITTISRRTSLLLLSFPSCIDISYKNIWIDNKKNYC